MCFQIHGKAKHELHTLMNSVRTYTDDIKKKIEITKCATSVMKRKKLEHDGIQLSGGIAIEALGEDAFKCLGML